MVLSSLDQPLRIQNLLDSNPLTRVVADHSLEKPFHLLQPHSLLEFKFAAAVATPKGAELFVHDLFEVGVWRFGELEGEFVEDQREEDHSQREYVCFGCVVLHWTVFRALMDLWSHVALPGTFVFIKFERAFVSNEAGSEAQISDFEDQLTILNKNEYVLQFEVAMRDPLRVKVGESLNDMPKSLPLWGELWLFFLKVVQ